MSMSRSEFKSLVLRAARGAGVPISQAEELARVMASVPLEKLDELTAIAAASLDGPRMSPTFSCSDGVTTITRGDMVQCIPAAIDLALAGEVVDHPENPLVEYWANYRGLTCDGDRLCVAGRELPMPTGRIVLTKDVSEILERLSAKTYVPSTEQSRAGAGAGDIDNS